MKLNWNFQGEGGGGGREVQNKKPSMGGVWIFSGTAHFGTVPYIIFDYVYHFWLELSSRSLLA